MSIHLSQLAPEPILCYTFSGHLTYADLEALRYAEDPYFAALPDRGGYDIIADLSALDTIDAALFPQLQEMRLVCDTRVCAVVIVGANPYLRALAISLGLVTQRREFLFRNTLTEALVLLGAGSRV